MEPSTSAQILFQIIDKNIDYSAKQIRNRIFSVYRDLPWTPEQRSLLQPLVRQELEVFVQSILAALDNVGGVLPDGVLGYSIISYSDDPGSEDDQGTDIRFNNDDYEYMWLDYLRSKQ